MITSEKRRDAERLPQWKARWVAAPDANLGSWHNPTLPAPFFRRVFTCDAGGRAMVRLCGLGYYEEDEQIIPFFFQYSREKL